jgi:signal transduction histidine kinase
MHRANGAAPNAPPRPGEPHRRSWLQSLSTRFLIVVVSVALLGVGTVALVANQVTARQFTLYVSRGRQARAQQWAQLAAEHYQRTGSWEGVGAVFEEALLSRGLGQGRGRRYGQQGQETASSSDDRLLIVDPGGRIVFDSEEELLGQSIETHDQARGAPIASDGQMVGALLVTTRDLSDYSEFERRFLETVNRAVLWAVLLVVAVSLIAATLLSRQLIDPLRQLTAAAEAMADGDLTQRVATRSQDEVGELAGAFNQMASDLEAAEGQRRQMTADIAHELRNPLSIIRGNLEAMFDGVYPADVEHLAPIYEETLLLQRLVEDLRLLSLAEAGQLRLMRSDVDVEELLRGIAEGAQAVAQDKGIVLQVDVPEPSRIVGDADRLRQVIGNLVSNALRYTPAGGTIALRAHPIGKQSKVGWVRIAVSDTGPGIPPEDLPHVFDRFYRGDPARGRTSGGSGLGLAIARALIEAHGGTIEVESGLGHGTTFTVELAWALEQ